MTTEKMTTEQREKLKSDIKTWCRKKGLYMRDLSKNMGYRREYLANILAGTQNASLKFWFNLKEKTGLEEENYNDLRS